MSEPIYLYGLGNRRHIARTLSPNETLCGSYVLFMTDEEFAAGNWPAQFIARQRALPVCKTCVWIWDKQVTS